jgi:hypothetical protein
MPGEPLGFADIEQACIRASSRMVESPDLLFHYTSAESLLGIVETGSLWASQIRYLNDAAELLYSVRLAADVLDVAIPRRPEPLRSALAAARESLIHAEAERFFYIGAFSEDGDLLSQWRAYGDAGGGYAVGIRMAEVRRLSAFPMVRKVDYEEERQRRLIEAMVTTAIEAVGDPAAEESVYSALRALAADLAVAGAFFKHWSFKEEREWRALRIAAEQDEAIEFRAAAGIIVPFVPIPLHEEESGGRSHTPIGQVVCGPTLQPTLSRRAVDLLLRGRGYKGYQVRSSRVPLRSRPA